MGKIKETQKKVGKQRLFSFELQKLVQKVDEKLKTDSFWSRKNVARKLKKSLKNHKGNFSPYFFSTLQPRPKCFHSTNELVFNFLTKVLQFPQKIVFRLFFEFLDFPTSTLEEPK